MPVPPFLDRWRATLADRLPLGLREGRLAVSPAAAIAVALVAVVAVAGTALAVWHGRARSVTVSAPASSSSSTPPSTSPSSLAPVAQTSPSAGSSPTSVGRVVVDVAGRVRHPGVATLAAGARVIDALSWAGGALPGTDTSSLDLARPLTDGEQVYLGPPGGGANAAGPAPAAPDAETSGSSGSGSAAPLDLNTATADQLDGLPGVGPVLAGRIIDWRTTHGRFGSVDELRQVSGLGGKKFETLRPLVRV